MARIPPSSSQGREVTPEEGQVLLVLQMMQTLDRTQEIAAEQTWDAYALMLVKDGARLQRELGLVQFFKLQQMCAEMILKIRLANRKAPESNDDILAEYEQMLAEVFAPEGADGPDVPDLDDEEAD